MASISFGIAGFAGAFNVFVAVGKADQERRYIRTTFIIAATIVIFCMMPLILENDIKVFYKSSIVMSVMAALVEFHILREVLKGKTKLQNKKTFWALFSVSVIWTIMLAGNGVYLGSDVVYKTSIMWAFIVHLYRFYLLVTHVSTFSKPN